MGCGEGAPHCVNARVMVTLGWAGGGVCVWLVELAMRQARGGARVEGATHEASVIVGEGSLVLDVIARANGQDVGEDVCDRHA